MQNKKLSRAFYYYLVLTAVLCGALVMVIEVLGSRIIGPFFGVSLFVWTSLITVTLIALAAGYAIGGILADRRGTSEYLYGIILIAGFMTFTVPFMKEDILKFCLPYGLRGGAFISTTLLFGPSLFLLGCVSPYIVKIAAREMQNIGRTVGSFYALSTFGSVIGTLLTGFVLIAYISVDRIFVLVSSLLICISAGYFIFFRRSYLAPLVLIPLPLFMPGNDQLVSVTMPGGTKATEIAVEYSFYGDVKVVDYTYQNIHTRELVIDGMVQGGIDPRNNLSIYEYPYYLQFIPFALNPTGENCLVIGLGAGVIPRWYEEQGISVEAVDIDPKVVKLARTYFSLPETIPVAIEDARYYLMRSEIKYDYVILDVFNGDITPNHLLTLELFSMVRSRMNSNAIVAINMAGSLINDTYVTASVVKTLKEVFDQVELYPTFNPEQSGGVGNIAVIAYSGLPRNIDVREFVKGVRLHPLVQKTFRDNFGRKFTFSENTPSIVLTDNYNPVDYYNTALRETVRQKILENTHWDILLSSG